MPNNNSVPPETPKTNSSESKGFFAGLTNAVANLVPGNKNKKPNNSSNASPATSTNNSKKANNSAKNGNVVKTSTNNTNVKPVTAELNAPTSGGAASVNYRSAHMQPSEAVMRWATTADAEMPSAAEMRGVAHGGTRRNKNRSRRNKTGGTRRNRNRSRRNKTGGNRRNKNRSRRNRRN
jgi:hypothetical protein